MQMADYFSDYEIHIYCSCDVVELNNLLNPRNVFIHKNIEKCEHYYLDSKLIISRAGRNTISELLCLEIPSIIIPAGDDFRAKEQAVNSEQAKKANSRLIKISHQNTTIDTLVSTCQNILTSNSNKPSMKWQCGNLEAENLILKLYKSKMK